LLTLNGHAVVLGSEPGEPYLGMNGNVWRESDNGATWTLVGKDAPTIDRPFAICGTLNGALYVMGGQTDINDPSTALRDVWRSNDGGATWARLPDAPWSPRGIVTHTVEHDGKLFVIGGGRYADIPFQPDCKNGVFTFDGTSWQTVLPDGHAQFAPSAYHGVLTLGGRLWVLNGYDFESNLARAVVSDDDGATWTTFADGAGGTASHADAVATASGRILRISGDLADRTIYEISQ
jgi:N-acetylneuraminic acid mutarotase